MKTSPQSSNPSETKLSTVEQKTSQCGRQDALTINFMTTRARERRDARRLVAMYSIEAPDRLADSPAQVLGTVLNRNAANSETRDIVSPWRKFFESLSADKPEPDALTKVVAVEAEKLRVNWVTLYNSNSGSKDDQIDLETFDPTFQGVRDLIISVTETLEAKRKTGASGRITSGFHSFCDKLDSHAAFLKMLPDGNEYVSVFTGSLSAIIKASVNHGRVAEELAEALCDISEDVAECRIDIELYATSQLIGKVAELYAHIFAFLSSYMDHLMRNRSKRFIESFNENSSQRFAVDIKRIKDKSSRIRYMVQQSHIAEGKETLRAVEQIAQDIRVGQEGDQRRWAVQDDYILQMKREQEHRDKEQSTISTGMLQLGFMLKDMLELQALDHLAIRAHVAERHNQATLHREPGLLQFYQQTAMSTPSGQPTSSQQFADHVRSSSANLEDFFYRDRVRIPGRVPGPATAPPQALRRLVDWTNPTTSSRLLWIEGPPISADDQDNPVSVLSNTVASFADQCNVPVMSYFCQLRRRERLRGNNTAEEQGLYALVVALIRQSAERLFPMFDSNIDLSATRMSTLDGTMVSWNQALLLLKDMASLLRDPDKVLCIIDGIHWVDDRRTGGRVRELIEVLRGTGFRVLLTTSGRTASLRQVVPRAETLVVEAFGRNDEPISQRQFNFGT